MLSRRFFLGVLTGAIAAPLLVRADALMPIRGYRMLPFVDIPSWCPPGWMPADGRTVGRAQFPALYDACRHRRELGAHLSDESFQLPSSVINAHGYTMDQYMIPIVNVVPMARSNGRVVPPGSIDRISVTRHTLMEEPLPDVTPGSHGVWLTAPVARDPSGYDTLGNTSGYAERLNVPGEPGHSRSDREPKSAEDAAMRGAKPWA